MRKNFNLPTSTITNVHRSVLQDRKNNEKNVIIDLNPELPKTPKDLKGYYVLQPIKSKNSMTD